MKLVRANSAFDWQALLDLIRASFANMEGRIDPPSSMHHLTPEAIEHHARCEEVWAIMDPKPIACVFLTAKPDRLYLGKLAVDPKRQGEGLGRRLIETAMRRTQEQGLEILELETRIELTENHAIFAKYGFVQVAQTAHPGYASPTSLTLHYRVSQD